MKQIKVTEDFKLKFDMDIRDRIKQNANKLNLSKSDYLNLIINRYIKKVC